MGECRRIANLFAMYAERVIHEDATDDQKKELKRAFYMGARLLLLDMLDEGQAHDGNVSKSYQQGLYEESEQFVKDVEEGRA